MKDNKLDILVEHLLNDDKPSIFFEEIQASLKNTPLDILLKLKNIEQNPEFHPEGNIWNHTMQVIDVAAKVKEFTTDKEIFMLGALFHDLGKIPTTRRNKKGRLVSYNHDTEGQKLTEDILNYYNVESDKKEKIVNLVRYHMHHIYILKDLPFSDMEGLKKNVNLKDIILLFISDKLGRNQKEEDKKLKEINEVRQIIITLKEKYNYELDDSEELINKVIDKIK